MPKPLAYTIIGIIILIIGYNVYSLAVEGELLNTLIAIIVLILLFALLFYVLGFIFELKEHFWPKPRHPSHICSNCLALYERSQADVKEICGYCDSDLATMSFLEPLEEFFARVPLEKLKNHKEELQQRLKKSRGNRARLIRVSLIGVKRIISLKQTGLKKEAV